MLWACFRMPAACFWSMLWVWFGHTLRMLGHDLRLVWHVLGLVLACPGVRFGHCRGMLWGCSGHAFGHAWGKQKIAKRLWGSARFSYPWRVLIRNDFRSPIVKNLKDISEIPRI